jgi:hypothetical protein
MYTLQIAHADVCGTIGRMLLFETPSGEYLDIQGSLWTIRQKPPDVRPLAGRPLLFGPINTPYPF